MVGWRKVGLGCGLLVGLGALGCASTPPSGNAPGATSGGDEASFKVGDRVQCQWQSGPRWYSGKVAAVTDKHELEVHYDDGDKELTHAPLCKHHTGGAAFSPRRITGEADETLTKRFEVGDRVSCRWKAGARRYSGKVAGIKLGRLSIDYDDGDKELINPGLCESGTTALLPAPPRGPKKQPLVQGGGLSGNYNIIQGVSPNGKSSYSGALKLSKTGNSLYQLNWKLVDGSQYVGVGLHDGDLLGVGWGAAGQGGGVVVYDVEGGTLKGRWAGFAAEGIGVENLRGPTGLSGTYQITEAKNPGGKSYTGQVQIRPNGATYQFTWKLTRESYSGVGIKVNDRLIVGWGQGGIGAVAYGVEQGRLNGVWATDGSNQLGKETAELGTRL